MDKTVKKFLNAKHTSLENKFSTLYDTQCRNVQDVSNLLEHSHMHVFFDTTYACDLSCGHCIYSADSKQPLTFIPAQEISHLVNKARTEHEHVCAYALFGGEPTLAEIHNNGYFKTVADAVRDNRQGLRMSTNANWINGEHAEYLIEQIMYIYRTVSLFQFQLSVDRFHKDSVQSAIKVIKQLDKYPELEMAHSIVVRGFNFDKELEKHFTSLKTQHANIRTYFTFNLIPSGRAASLRSNTRPAPQIANDEERAIILGDEDISGNIAFAAMNPCHMCNQFFIELHFTPDQKAFVFDRLDYTKHITDIKNPDGTYKTYKQIKRDIAKSIFARYQIQILK